MKITPDLDDKDYWLNLAKSICIQSYLEPIDLHLSMELLDEAADDQEAREIHEGKKEVRD
jgi:hypothetical protein